MDGPIAVLAGTPVDTRMGVEYLTDRGLPGLAFPVSDGPREQTAFQHAPAEEKQRRAREILEAAGSQGCRRAFVYCNSLSGAVDFPALAEETGLRIVTPLDVYRLLAPRYHRLAVIAANAQGLSGIEGVLLQANPQLDLLGACSLPVVLSVEAATEPSRLVEQHHLMDLAAWFAGCGAEALVLGCTHFQGRPGRADRAAPGGPGGGDGPNAAGLKGPIPGFLKNGGLREEARSPLFAGLFTGLFPAAMVQ